MGRVEGYRNFCNKLWNAARYVLMNTEGRDVGLSGGEIELGQADRWILSRLQQTIAEANAAVRDYRFDQMAQSIYEFTWNEFCDWYLELSKPVLTDPASAEAAQRGTRQTLVQVLETLLRLLHPLMPFITEEIWQRVAPLAGPPDPPLPKGGAEGGGISIMLQPYPEADKALVDAGRGSRDRMAAPVSAGGAPHPRRDEHRSRQAAAGAVATGRGRGSGAVGAAARALLTLGRLESIAWLGEEEPAPEAATALVGGMKILIPMAGLIDKAAESARLDKEIAKLRQEAERGMAKLDNANFIGRAPAEVVEKERARVAELQLAATKLEEQLARIRQL